MMGIIGGVAFVFPGISKGLTSWGLIVVWRSPDQMWWGLLADSVGCFGCLDVHGLGVSLKFVGWPGLWWCVWHCH